MFVKSIRAGQTTVRECAKYLVEVHPKIPDKRQLLMAPKLDGEFSLHQEFYTTDNNLRIFAMSDQGKTIDTIQ